MVAQDGVPAESARAMDGGRHDDVRPAHRPAEVPGGRVTRRSLVVLALRRRRVRVGRARSRRRSPPPASSISIDALRPEFYLDPAFDTPTLRALVAGGQPRARGRERVPDADLSEPRQHRHRRAARAPRHRVQHALRRARDGGSRWYEEAADLRAPPLWAWARAAGLTTAAVSLAGHARRADRLARAPSATTARARIPCPMLIAASTPGLFTRIGVTPRPSDVQERGAVGRVPDRDGGRHHSRTRARTCCCCISSRRTSSSTRAAATAAGRRSRRSRGSTRTCATLRQALAAAGIADRTTMIVTGDHGFQDVRDYVLSQPRPRPAPGCAAVPRVGGLARHRARRRRQRRGVRRIRPATRTPSRARRRRCETRGAAAATRVLTRAELDAMGAMTGAALALEADAGLGHRQLLRPRIDGARAGRTGGRHARLPAVAGLDGHGLHRGRARASGAAWRSSGCASSTSPDRAARRAGAAGRGSTRGNPRRRHRSRRGRHGPASAAKESLRLR